MSGWGLWSGRCLGRSWFFRRVAGGFRSFVFGEVFVEMFEPEIWGDVTKEVIGNRASESWRDGVTELLELFEACPGSGKRIRERLDPCDLAGRESANLVNRFVRR